MGTTQTPPVSAPAASGLRSWLARNLHRLAAQLDPDAIRTVSAPTYTVVDYLVNVSKKLFRRIMIWLLSFAVAFYVPLSEAGLPFPLEDWETKVDATSKSADVFLAVVAMVVLSASDLIDNIIARRSQPVGILILFAASVLMFGYFLFVFYGMPKYGSLEAIKAHGGLPWNLLVGLLVAGLVGEIIIATVPD